jgi:hypothetical protein
MSKSLSEAQLGLAFRTILGSLLVAAAVFYWLQNNDYLPGGHISLVKLAWLGYAILFWYLLPGLLLMDARMPAGARRVCIALLAGMLLRGVVELVMMYASGNWHPWMGISHNLLMLMLLSATLVPLVNHAERLYSIYFLVAMLMFIPESGFAWYMLNYASEPGATVYFVPGDPQHRGVMTITGACVLALSIYLYFFYRQWMNDQTRHQLP